MTAKNQSGAGCGGLPFYRLATGSPRTCAEFCLSKSLDLSGVLDGVQCRCGASAKHPIWHTRARPDLQWSLDCKGEEILPPSPPEGYGNPPTKLEQEIPFSFASGLPNETKEVFQEAADKEKWRWTWCEDGLWAMLTQILKRLGPTKVDPCRIYVTGLSLGASGSWHLALRYGQYLAGLAPVSGVCNPLPEVLERLANLPVRAYQIDVDRYAGSPVKDFEWLCWGLKEEQEDLSFGCLFM
eukprot:g9822.t1